MNYVFIINPVAGKGRDYDDIARRVREFFEDRSENVSVYLSKAPGDAIRFGKEFPLAEGEETCFVACGGDGTFYEVVNGAFGRPGVSFAVYPSGSGNDFIKSIGGKHDDYLDFQKLIDGEIKYLDAIDCSGKICSNLCNIGIDSIICDRIPRYKKIPGVSGAMAYNISVVLTIAGCFFKSAGKKMVFTFDDGEVLDGKFMLSVFGNGRIYGGGYCPVPEAVPDDGIIDFCAIDETDILRLSKLLNVYKAGKHVSDPKFEGILHMRRCTSVHIESPEEMTVCLDGEIAYGKSVDIKVLPKALPFRIPKFG